MLIFIEPITGVRFTELPDPWKGKISPLTLKNCESLGWVIEGLETTEDVLIGAPPTTTTTTTTSETPTNEEWEEGESTPTEEVITEEAPASPTISLRALAGILDAQYEPLPESSASYAVSMPYALSPLEDTTFLPYTFPDTTESPDAVEKTLSLRSMLLAEELLLTEDPLVAATTAPLFIVPTMDEALDMEFAAHAEWYSLLEEQANPLYGIVGEEFVSPPVAAWNASQSSISSPEEYMPFSYLSRKCRKVFEESGYYREDLHGLYKQRALYASERWTLCRVDYALTLDLANAIAEGRDEEPALRPILTREGLGDNLHWPAAFEEKGVAVDGYVQADDLDPEEPVVFAGLGQLSYDTEKDAFQSSIALMNKPLPRIDQSINGASRATADNFIVRKVFSTPFLEHPFYKRWQTFIHPEMSGFPQMLQSIGTRLDEAYSMADILSHHEQVRIDVPPGAMYVEIMATEPVERKGAEKSYVIMTEDSVSARILYDAIPYARVYPDMDINRSRIRPMNADGYATRDIQGAMCILLDLMAVHAYTKGLQIRWWFSPTKATIWLPLEYHRSALTGIAVQPYVPPLDPLVFPTPSESGTGWLRVVEKGFSGSIEWMDVAGHTIKYPENTFIELPAGYKSIDIYEVGGRIITGVPVYIMEGVMLTGTLSADTMSWDVSVTSSERRIWDFLRIARPDDQRELAFFWQTSADGSSWGTLFSTSTHPKIAKSEVDGEPAQFVDAQGRAVLLPVSYIPMDNIHVRTCWGFCDEEGEWHKGDWSYSNTFGVTLSRDGDSIEAADRSTPEYFIVPIPEDVDHCEVHILGADGSTFVQMIYRSDIPSERNFYFNGEDVLAYDEANSESFPVAVTDAAFEGQYFIFHRRGLGYNVSVVWTGDNPAVYTWHP